MEKNSLKIIAGYLPLRFKEPVLRALSASMDKATDIVLRTDRPLWR